MYEEGKTIYEIADVCKLSRSATYAMIKRSGVPRRKRGPSPRRISVTEMWLRKRYVEEDATLIEMAKEYGCQPQAIAKALERAGIQRRKARVRDSKIIAHYLKHDEFHAVPRLKNAMIWLYGKKCQLPDCGYWLFVDVHHIRGKGFRDRSGRRHTNNRISECILLCPNHHREADNGLISVEDLEKLIQTRKLKT